MLLATKDDVLKYYSRDKVDQQGNALKYWTAMSLRAEKNFGARRISKLINIPEGAVHYWLQGYKPKSIHGLVQLEKMSLLPLKVINNDSFKHFIHTWGLRYSDGCIYEQKRNNSFTFYLCFGNKIDALNYIRDTKRIWKIDLVEHFSSRAYYIYLPASLARLFIHLGSPIGRKTFTVFRIPKWIFNLPPSLKWEFVSGLFSGDGSVPKLKPYGACCESLRFSLNSEKSIVESFRDNFMKDLWKLLSDMNIKATFPKIVWKRPRVAKDYTITYPIDMRILTQKNNMIYFLKNISYRYCNKANSKVDYIIEVLKGKNQLEKVKENIKKPNLELSSQIKVLLKRGYTNNLIESSANALKNQRGKYQCLAEHLKRRCKSIEKIKFKSVRDSYLSKWKKNKIFIPFDCVIVLLTLSKRNLKEIEKQIEVVKYKNVRFQYAIKF